MRKSRISVSLEQQSYAVLERFAEREHRTPNNVGMMMLENLLPAMESAGMTCVELRNLLLRQFKTRRPGRARKTSLRLVTP